jgi:hypothetical protein
MREYGSACLPFPYGQSWTFQQIVLVNIGCSSCLLLHILSICLPESSSIHAFRIRERKSKAEEAEGKSLTLASDDIKAIRNNDIIPEIFESFRRNCYFKNASQVLPPGLHSSVFQETTISLLLKVHDEIRFSGVVTADLSLVFPKLLERRSLWTDLISSIDISG